MLWLLTESSAFKDSDSDKISPKFPVDHLFDPLPIFERYKTPDVSHIKYPGILDCERTIRNWFNDFIGR
jgi:hypothetical protein